VTRARDRCWSRYDGKISLSQDSFRKRAEIDFNFLDLFALDSQVLGIPKFGAGDPLTFITNKSFIPFFKELLSVERLERRCERVKPSALPSSLPPPRRTKNSLG
jgi:hypothetical protein